MAYPSRKHTLYKILNCNFVDVEDEEEDHENNIDEYKCEICGKGFDSVKGVHGHMRIHAKEKEPPPEVQSIQQDNNDEVVVVDHNIRANDFVLRISQQITDQAQRMMRNVDDNDIRMPIKIDGRASSVRIQRMQSDGNCLFSALFHQLSDICNSETVQQFREEIVNEIESNEDNYVVFLNNHLADDEYDILDISDGDGLRQLRAMLLGDLRTDGIWGGQETIVAASRIYGVNILVFTKNSGFRFEAYNADYDRTIMIAFVNRNHYNSVVDVYERQAQRIAQILLARSNMPNIIEID